MKIKDSKQQFKLGLNIHIFIYDKDEFNTYYFNYLGHS